MTNGTDMSYSGTAVDHVNSTHRVDTIDENSTVTIWNDTVQSGGLDFSGISPNYMSLVVHKFNFIKVCISLVSFAVNALVFSATSKVSEESLKSKTLIQNAILADIAFGILTSLRSLAYLLRIFEVPDNTYYVVYNNLRTLTSVVMYWHLFAAVLLAGDRMYAVFKPLTYYTVGYKTLSKILLFTVSWLGSVVLALPGILIPFIDERVAKSPLEVKLEHGYLQYSRNAMSAAAVVTNLLIFCMYIVIFFAFQLQGRSNRALAESQSLKRKTSLSLTITYFLIHFSSLCFYLPGPLFILALDSQATLTLDMKALITHNLISLYVINTVLNPIILVTRIRLIRQNLRFVLKRRISRQNKEFLGTNSTDALS